VRLLTRLRIVLVIGTTFTGCVSATSPSIFPQFRHPLFHDSTIGLDSATSKEASIMPDIVARRPIPACTSSFSHPLLNSCRNNLVSPRKHLEVLYTPASGSDISDLHLALASQARSMLHHPKYNINGRRFRQDCSGFVLATLTRDGIDTSLLKAPGVGGSGVAAIYTALWKRGLVHHHKVPAIGDLVFFNNTFDRNGDGRNNDLLTHVGIVERVDSDGTVTFIHHVRRGVLRYKMNLFTPHTRRQSGTGKVLNHHLRAGSGVRAHSARLTGELFHAFATIIK